MGRDAAAEWSAALAALAIPDHILESAPESPYGFPTRLFERVARHTLEQPATPSRERAREALDGGGMVLDVGVGGGAASLPLAPPATSITGVDQSARMLEMFARTATERGLRHREVEGSWPEVAASVDDADVVVCHHVFYNAPELEGFARALTHKARRRVVVELTARHPMCELNDLWRHFHGLDRPEGPDAKAAIAVLREMGIEPATARWQRPSLWRDHAPERVAFVRKRLCLGPDRDVEIAELLGARDASPNELVTLWWEGLAQA
jgi:SAM-dependent methyltransferase